MKKVIFLVFVVCSMGFSLTAQTKKSAIEILNYDWGEAQFEQTTLAENDTTEAYILKEVNKIEWTYNDEDNLDCYQLYHFKVKINNNKGLEYYNTLSFSTYSYNEIITLKARFINEKGKIINLDKTNLKKIEEDETTRMLLAIEGAEAGGIIEYYWIKKGHKNIYGNYYIQSGLPVKQAVFSITSPINLKYISKSYNGCPEMKETVDSINERRTLLLEAKDIPALIPERRAYYTPHLQRVEYTLTYNLHGKNRILSRATASQSIYSNYAVIDSKEQKKVNSYIKKMGISNNLSEEQKIRKIENYIKTNIQLLDDVPGYIDLSYIPDIISNKYTDERGYTRLLIATFKQLGIPYELVVTCDKTERTFDKDFDGYNFLDDFLFYFPNINLFLDPNSMMNRLGYIDESYLDSEGLFLRTVSMSGVESYVSSIKAIPGNDYAKTVHITKSEVKIDPTNFVVDYTWDNTFLGYTAVFLQPFFYYATEENKKMVVESFMLGDDSSNDKLVNYTIKNEKPEDWAVKPLQMSIKYSGDVLLSRAGDNFLFKIGELLGKQVEMYREKERILPVEDEACRMYDREIIVHIPDGYKIANPDALKMKVELVMDGEAKAYFYSDHTISGQTLTVKCTEVYKIIYYPLEKYSEYVAVINAAADFNKINLLFVKQ